MALCWSLDKCGPIARSVEDCALVLEAINGFDPADAGSIAAGFTYDFRTPITGLRLGFDPAWLEEATETEAHAIETAKGLGATLVPFTVPNLPAAEGDGEPMTAVEAFTVIDENGDSRTIQRGDRFGSEHPIVADHPSNFVRFNIPKVEQRDCAVWTNPQ